MESKRQKDQATQRWSSDLAVTVTKCWCHQRHVKYLYLIGYGDHLLEKLGVRKMLYPERCMKVMDNLLQSSLQQLCGRNAFKFHIWSR